MTTREIDCRTHTLAAHRRVLHAAKAESVNEIATLPRTLWQASSRRLQERPRALAAVLPGRGGSVLHCFPGACEVEHEKETLVRELARQNAMQGAGVDPNLWRLVHRPGAARNRNACQGHNAWFAFLMATGAN